MLFTREERERGTEGRRNGERERERKHRTLRRITRSDDGGNERESAQCILT